jgi:hypothetical protein
MLGRTWAKQHALINFLACKASQVAADGQPPLAGRVDAAEKIAAAGLFDHRSSIDSCPWYCYLSHLAILRGLDDVCAVSKAYYSATSKI